MSTPFLLTFAKLSQKVFTEINFYKRPGGQSKAGPGRPERGLAGKGGFLRLRTISHFTYEMVNNQSETARDGGFRERRTGCPLLPARPAGCHLPISLVKSDWKLQQKNAFFRRPFPVCFPPALFSLSFFYNTYIKWIFVR